MEKLAPEIYDLFDVSNPAPRFINKYDVGRLSYSKLTWKDESEADYQAAAGRAKVFQPNEQLEEIISSIEFDLQEFSDSFTKRRQIEKKTAKYLREVVAPAGVMANAHVLADRLDSCRNSGVMGVDLNSGRKIIKWQEKCGLVKLCPDESRAEQKRLSRRYVYPVQKWLEENPRRQFQYAVFEPVNIPVGDLCDKGQRWLSEQIGFYANGKKKIRRWKNPDYIPGGLSRAFDEFRNLLRHESFKNVDGCFAALECPLSKDGKSWNVHINALLLVGGHFDWKKVRCEYGARIHFESSAGLEKKTREYLTRRNGGVPVELSKTDNLVCAFREIIKYSAKHVTSKSEVGKTDAPAITDWPPCVFAEWWAAHHKFRRCRSYGVLNGFEEPDKEAINIQWVGSIEFDLAQSRYAIALTGRPSIISLQGDKSAGKTARKTKDKPPDLFKNPSGSG